MFKHFAHLQWKAFLRSSSFGKSLGLKIVMGFMAAYFALLFLLLGLGLFPLLKELYPGEEPINKANEFLLLWLWMELIIRFMLQNLPVISIKPLMVTPVKKRKVVNYVLIRSFFSFFNFLPLLVILPFMILTYISSDLSALSVVGWGATVYALDLSMNYINFLLKKKFSDDLKALLPYILVIAVVALLEFFQLFQVSLFFATAMDYVILHPALTLLPILLVGVLFKLNQKVLESRFYLDESLKGKIQEADRNDFQWVRRFGEIAPFLQLDLKLIWRNKRPRTLIFLSLLITGYGMIFYPEENYHDVVGILAFVGIFMTGIFMINFGQFIPSWDSSYYPMIMAQNIPFKKYLYAKAGLMAFSVVILTILTTPYVYFGWKILVINICCAVYNIGVNIPLLLYAGSFNRKRIELEQSPFLNIQGTGATQWLIALPLMIIPILIFWLFTKFFSFGVGVMVLIGMGIIGIILKEYLLERIEEAYLKNKYAMINGFKQAGE